MKHGSNTYSFFSFDTLSLVNSLVTLYSPSYHTFFVLLVFLPPQKKESMNDIEYDENAFCPNL